MQETNQDNSQRDDLRQAVEVLRRGGIIIYPTDTVWGIGCDARNSEAVKRIYKVKQRADNKAMITLVSDLTMLERTVCGIPDVAYSIIEYSEKPTTIVYDKGINVAPELIGSDGTLGVRVTRDTFSAELCRRLGAPIVSTSANISGYPTPQNFTEIDPTVLDAADYVCLWRREDYSKAKPSSVMRLGEDGTFVIIRQ